MVWSLVAVVGTISVAFVVGRVRHRYRDIDVFWPLGFVAVAISGFASTAGTDADAVQRFLQVGERFYGASVASAVRVVLRGDGQPERPARLTRRA